MNWSALQHPSWLPIVILLALAALTTWLGRLAEAPAQDASAVKAHVPDYVVELFHATAFDAAGRPRYRLSAERMTHFLDDDSTVLDAPRFAREEVGYPDLRARSERGRISANGQHVYLLKDVRVEQDATRGQAAMTMTTDYLDVMPDARTMRTDKPVRVVRGADVIDAGALWADANKRELVLASGVRGVYESKH